MKKVLHIATFVCAVGLAFCASSETVDAGASGPNVFRDGDTVVFFGDSITHGGRYHEFVADYYLTRFPEAKIRIVNSGIGGDTASGAFGRIAVDVAEYNPTWVGFHFGMNDIGRGYYSATPTADQLMGMDAAQKRYRANLAQLVAKVRAVAPKARHIYFTPTIYDDTAVPTNMPKGASGWAAVNQRGCNTGLGLMAGHVLSAAKRDGALGVDWYTPLENFLMKRRANDPHYLLTSWDRVHPGALGHSIMAWRFLRAQGAPSVVSDVTVDAAGGRAVASTNAVVSEIARTGDSLSFTLAARALPFPIAPEALDAARELGVEESLNRETLRVTGLGSGTWELRIDGDVVGAWSAEEFAKGVRLGFNPKTPQYRQAQEVFRRRAELTAEESTLRNHHSARWSYGIRGAPVDDLKAFADWFEKNEKDKTAYFAKFVPGYLAYWPHYRETRADLASRQEAVRVLARPRPHRYELGR